MQDSGSSWVKFTTNKPLRRKNYQDSMNVIDNFTTIKFDLINSRMLLTITYYYCETVGAKYFHLALYQNFKVLHNNILNGVSLNVKEIANYVIL